MPYNATIADLSLDAPDSSTGGFNPKTEVAAKTVVAPTNSTPYWKGNNKVATQMSA